MGRVFDILYSNCNHMYELLGKNLQSLPVKTLPLKMGLPSLGVYYVIASSWKDCYPITYTIDFLIFFSGFTPDWERFFVFCK